MTGSAFSGGHSTLAEEDTIKTRDSDISYVFYGVLWEALSSDLRDLAQGNVHVKREIDVEMNEWSKDESKLTEYEHRAGN